MKFVRLGLVVLLLLAVTETLGAEEPKRLLLVGQGPDNHPAGTHEYMAGVERLAKLLEADKRVKTEVVRADGEWTDGPELIENSDGLVLFVSEGARWCSADPRRYEALTKLAARGGGLSVLHWGMGTREVGPRLSRRSGFLLGFAADHSEQTQQQSQRSKLVHHAPSVLLIFHSFPGRDALPWGLYKGTIHAPSGLFPRRRKIFCSAEMRC